MAADERTAATELTLGLPAQSTVSSRMTCARVAEGHVAELHLIDIFRRFDGRDGAGLARRPDHSPHRNQRAVCMDPTSAEFLRTKSKAVIKAVRLVGWLRFDGC